MDLDTIIGSRVGTSVDINGMYVPANSIAEGLQRFAEPALFHTEGMGNYSLSKSGSLFKARLGEHFFAIVTSHQIRRPSYSLEQLCILNYETKKLQSSNASVFAEGIDQQLHEYDAQLFNFSDAVSKGRLSQAGWYDLDRDRSGLAEVVPTLVCAIGYPSHLNSIDYDEAYYAISPSVVWGKPTTSALQNRLAFQVEPPIDFDPSGMSGGPVFGIEVTATGPTLFFAGIVTEATAQKFNLISIRQLQKMFVHL